MPLSQWLEHMKQKTNIMEYKNQKEDRTAGIWADRIAGELWVSGDIGVMQANSVYSDIKKIILEAMLSTNDLRK